MPWAGLVETGGQNGYEVVGCIYINIGDARKVVASIISRDRARGSLGTALPLHADGAAERVRVCDGEMTKQKSELVCVTIILLERKLFNGNV